MQAFGVVDIRHGRAGMFRRARHDPAHHFDLALGNAYNRRHVVWKDRFHRRQVAGEIAPGLEELAHRVVRTGHAVVAHRLFFNWRSLSES